MNSEEGETNAARKAPWDDRPRWSTTRLRVEQMAVIEMLQTRHLRVTGKEISRSEVLAVLMAEGLENTLNHADFGAKKLTISENIARTTKSGPKGNIT